MMTTAPTSNLQFTAPGDRTDKERAAETKRTEIATRLLGLLQDGHVLSFRQPSGEPWVSLPRPDDHGYDHHRVENTLTVSWLMKRYTDAYGGVPEKRFADNAVATFAAKVRASTDVREVYDRLAVIDEPDGRVLYLDLGDAQHVVRITAGRWEVIPAPPRIAFRRATGFKELPTPVRLGPGETPDGVLQTLLRPVLNCPTTEEGAFNYYRMVAWVIAAYYTEGDQALLALTGEQGSGKSSVAETLRALIDPNTTRHGNSVMSADVVMFEAVRQYVPCFDNLRHLSDAVSDALANVATGSGQAKRKLYTDDDIISVFAKRPIILNGIHNVVKRPDLVDRAFVVELPPMDVRSRRFTKAQLRQRFEADRPRILGALLEVVASALDRLPGVLAAHAATGMGHYRLGDFHMFVRAAEQALGWPAGTADRIMQRQQAEKQHASMEQYADLEALRSLLFADRPIARNYGVREDDAGRTSVLRGAVGEVLVKLGAYAREQLGYDLRDALVGWPKLPKKFAQHLREAEAALAAEGIRLKFETARHKTIITIAGSLIDSTTAGETAEGEAASGAGSEGSQPAAPSRGSGLAAPGTESEGSQGSEDRTPLERKEGEAEEKKRGEAAALPSHPSPASPTPRDSGCEAGSQAGGTEALPPHTAVESGGAVPDEEPEETQERVTAAPAAPAAPAATTGTPLAEALIQLRAVARQHGGQKRAEPTEQEEARDADAA